MAEMDLDIVRHALEVARKNGFSEVDLSVGDASFSARLEPLPPKAKGKKAAAEAPKEPPLVDVKATLVGFLRSLKAVGDTVRAGEVVAVVEALGLANEVESSVGGEVVEVLANVDQPVQYGQILLRVRPQ